MFQVNDRVRRDSVNVNHAIIEINSDKTRHVRLYCNLAAYVNETFCEIAKMLVLPVDTIVPEKIGF
ncbi:MAG: hypothetical protein LBH46_04530, partial [Rickettsiales bacterium]|nr:hypothetical protein [Rickettsiales bacterium]